MKEGFLYKRGALLSPAGIASPWALQSSCFGKKAFAALQEMS